MKAILVIDMPSSCVMCEIRWGCKLWNRWKGYSDRLDGCPLKSLPDGVTKEETGAYVKGYQDALVSEVEDESNISG